MKYSPADWAVKRKSGIASYLFFDGVLKAGGSFAVVMQVIGCFLFRGETQTIGEYFSSSKSWLTFFLNATVFGLVIGFINWRRNENDFHSSNSLSHDAQK